MNTFEIKKGSLVVIPKEAPIINSCDEFNTRALNEKLISVPAVLEDGSIVVGRGKKILPQNIRGFEINKKNLEWLEFTSDQNNTLKTITQNGVEIVLLEKGNTFYWEKADQSRVPVKYIHEVQSLMYNDREIMPIFDLKSFLFRDSLIDGSSLVLFSNTRYAINGNPEWVACPGIYQVKEHTGTDNIVLSKQFEFNVEINDLAGALFNEDVLKECGFVRGDKAKLGMLSNCVNNLLEKDGVMIVGGNTLWDYLKPNINAAYGYEIVRGIRFHDLQYYVYECTGKPLAFNMDQVRFLLNNCNGCI